MNIKKLVRVAVPLLISLIGVVAAQEVTDAKPLVTIFPHPEGRFWISGQANFIFQGHGGFPALYSGPNGLRSTSEHALSRVFTLYTGVEVRWGTELLFDVESTGGRGISDALGLAVLSRTSHASWSVRQSHCQARSRSRSETRFRFQKQFQRNA